MYVRTHTRSCVYWIKQDGNAVAMAMECILDMCMVLHGALHGYGFDMVSGWIDSLQDIINYLIWALRYMELYMDLIWCQVGFVSVLVWFVYGFMWLCIGLKCAQHGPCISHRCR
jgi:p-aminobenzoyl-glutamate transporter AbgT